MIPKRIIQTGKSRSLPMADQAMVNTLRRLHPHFEYMFFDDDDVERFVDDEFPQHRALFESFPFRIQKYDFFRYLAVYRLGGFYFDLDILLAKAIDALCEHSCVLPFEEITLHRYLVTTHGVDWEVGNYAFGAEAGHPFIGRVIDNCIRAQRDPAWASRMWQSAPAPVRGSLYVLDTTGPGLVTRTLVEQGPASGPGEAVHVLFPDDVCNESSWHCVGDYGVHMQHGGWRPRVGYWRRRLTALWESRTRADILATARRRGPRRMLPGQAPA